MQEPTDLSFDVPRARDGDPIAIEVLTRRACRLAMRTAAVITSSREEAADISQDVAVDVLTSIAKLREPLAFDAWVHRITVRHTMRMLRRRNAARRAERPLALVVGPDEPTSREGIDQATLLATRDALAIALADLPSRQRLALALRYVHDLTDREIAAALGCRVGTANALLSRGRATLRRHPKLIDLAPPQTGGEPT